MVRFFFDNWARAENSLWLNTGDDGKIQIWPCKASKKKTILSWILTAATIGFLRVIFYWRPLLHALCTCDICEADTAEHILVKNENEYHLRMIRTAMWPDGLTLFCPGGGTVDVPSSRYFSFKKLIFVWHPLVMMFHKIFGFDTDVPLTLLAAQRGLTSSEANKRLAILGSNEIAVDLKPIYVLLFQELMSPFYFFQVFSVCVWYSESYNYYATIIIVLAIGSVSITVWQTRRNQRNLRNIMYSIGIATVWRDGEWRKKSTTVLVPGDIIFVADAGEMHCDAVLLRGSVIVNEAMLTGESVPTTKTPVRPESAQLDERYDSKEHAKQTLFCGTKILQTKHAPGEPVTAVVIRTGFSTTKGRLVRTIMYPKEAEFEFVRDLFRFIGVCFIVALIGFVYTIILMVNRGNGFDKIATRSLDIITIVVPPAIMVAITIGIIAAQRRLKNAFIYCTSPATINTAGGVNVVCFDKTGTLTEDGLDLFGIIPSSNIESNEPAIAVCELPPDGEMVRAMASCHSLTQLNDQLAGDPMEMILFSNTNWKLITSSSSSDGRKKSTYIRGTPSELTLPPLDDEKGDVDLMLVESADKSTRINLIHEYPFTSALRRMSVLVNVRSRNSESGLFLFCKGAPETVATLCSSDTVPVQFTNVLRSHAKCGFRMIALAYKRFDADENQAEYFLRMSRFELEKDMKFLGLIAFENRLKDQTIPSMKILKYAEMRTVMVTGDNMLTAISVARECSLLDDSRPIYTIEAEIVHEKAKITLHTETPDTNRVITSARKRAESTAMKRGFSIEIENEENQKKKLKSLVDHERLETNYQLAISGSSYAVITSKLPHLLPNLTATCDVYARMAPEQKIQLVTNLQKLGYVVAMCGDGANDCGALKAAHVGCSLSEAEASIASPFTSRVPDISCMPTLIREGRASLVTTFGVVQYMCCYSLTQFLAVVILYWIGSNLSDFEFLYSDLVLTTMFVIVFGFTAASNILYRIPPPTRIMTFSSVTSIIAQMILILAFQAFAFKFVEIQPWFVPYTFPGDDNNYYAYQTTCVFFTASFQQIVLCIIFSKSYPYRRTILSNYWLTAVLVATTAITIVLLLWPGDWLINFFNFKPPESMNYRAFIIVLALFHFFLAVATERLVQYLVPKIQPLSPFKRPKTKYMEILSSSVAINVNWLHANISDDDAMAGNSNGNAFHNTAFATEEL